MSYTPMEPQDIVNLYRERLDHAGKHIGRMIEICRFYNGDVIIPLPELDESEKPAIANLLAQGIDQLAIRASSRMPDLAFYTPLEADEKATERARKARLAMLAWWQMNNLALKFARSARHYVGYGSTTFMVKPVDTGYFDKRKMPYWHVVSPLNTFPCPNADPDSMEPKDIIVLMQQPLAWLKARYPVQAGLIFKGKNAKAELMFDILEYNDENETVLVLVGQKRGKYDYGDYEQGVSSCELLERYENKAGICLGVTAGRVTMDRLQGHFDQLLGLYLNQAQLQALELIAVKRTVFPEQWVVSHPNSPGEARILTYANAKQGDIGEVANGTILTVTPQVSQMTGQAVDRMERNLRVGAQLPAEVGGESSTNIRTAKRGAEVMGSAMDPNIGEAQNVYSLLWQAADERAIAVSKSEWGNKMTSFYIPKNGKQVGPGDFTPNDAFALDFHTVKFSMPGVDAAGIPIEIGQRLQTKIMSLQTGRQEDPMIEDGESEGIQVDVEDLETALKGGIAAQVQAGTIDVHEVALIGRLRRENPAKTLSEVVEMAQKQIQAQQAKLQQGQPGAPTPGAPETQPGMAQAPPTAGTTPGGGQAPPTFDQIMQQLRTPANQGGPEKALAGTAAGPPGAGNAPATPPVAG